MLRASAHEAINLAKDAFAETPKYHFRNPDKIDTTLPYRHTAANGALCLQVQGLVAAIDIATKPPTMDLSYLIYIIANVFNNVNSLSYSFLQHDKVAVGAGSADPAVDLDFDSLEHVYLALKHLNSE